MPRQVVSDTLPMIYGGSVPCVCPLDDNCVVSSRVVIVKHCGVRLLLVSTLCELSDLLPTWLSSFLLSNTRLTTAIGSLISSSTLACFVFLLSLPFSLPDCTEFCSSCNSSTTCQRCFSGYYQLTNQIRTICVPACPARHYQDTAHGVCAGEHILALKPNTS